MTTGSPDGGIGNDVSEFANSEDDLNPLFSKIDPSLRAMTPLVEVKPAQGGRAPHVLPTGAPLTVNGGEGNDSVKTVGLKVVKHLDGGPGVNMLTLKAKGLSRNDTGSQVLMPGFQPINHVNFQNRAVVPVELLKFEAE